jgi:hypothetical protein
MTAKDVRDQHIIALHRCCGTDCDTAKAVEVAP